MNRSVFPLVVLALSANWMGCRSHREGIMELHLTAFPREGTIPKPLTADGIDISPALSWTGAPEKTRAFALIMDDPDAPMGLWTHWTLFNVPPGTLNLAENQPKAPTLPDGSRQGRNTWGRFGYNGPSPPPGKPHRYFFMLFALSQFLDLDAGATREQLEDAMKGKILAEASWMGTYGR